MKKIILTLVLAVPVLLLSAQTPTYLISQQGTVSTCAADFYDSGGGGGSYSAGENFVMTFHSVNAVNTHIKMNFSTFDVDPSDTLIVYDGSSTASPVIGKYNNANLPPSFVKASIYNASGDLTFQFKSDGAINNAGWFSSIVCIPQCQDIIAALDTLLTVPAPDDSNYIDICIGDIITFAAVGSGPGVFPQNNILYAQDSATSLFIWDFGDGTTDTGMIVNHLYTLVRGYDVALTIFDNRGCVNNNYLGGRVRVSQSPFAEINALPDMCSSDDTSYITIGYNAASVVVVEPVTSYQSASQKFDSTMFIPDGPNCSVQCYNTFVTFTAFAPGTTITSPADILSICVNMEHSYAGDLGFRIICPNGQNVQLDPNTHSGGAYMGVPMGGANHDMYDNGCIPANNPYGTGWTYCWSEIYPQQGTMDQLSNGGGTIDSTNTNTNTNYITPENPLSALVGCPLNGTWNIEICDDFGIDNGYIFWWELNLDPSLLPTGWGYSVPIDTVIWSGSFINIINDTTIMVMPDSGGVYQYTVTVIDEFGCTYDTTLSIQVVQTPEVDLGPDTILCGTNIQFSLDAGTADHYIWSTSSSNQTIPITTTGIYSVTVENYNTGNTLTCSDFDDIFVRVLAEPYVDLGPDICSEDPVQISAGNPGFHYQWNTGDTSQTITAPQSGTYSVTVAEQFGYGCEDSDDITVFVYPVPLLSIGPDSTICRHHTIKLDAYDPNGYLQTFPYTFAWYLDHIPYNLTDPAAREIVLNWLTPGIHMVELVVTGCNSTADTMMLTVEPCDLTIPNIITPNADSYNDFMVIPNVEYYPNSTMIIYNRWGKKVFESSNYHNEWDGGNCADGVYYYVFTVNYGDHGNGLETKQLNGTVTILR